MSTDDRIKEKMLGGVIIEDDGGFINFVPSVTPESSLGGILGVGLEEEDLSPLTENTPVLPTGSQNKKCA